MDKMAIEILADGTIKSTISGKVSMPNHQNAEMFLRDIARLAGGETTRNRIGELTVSATEVDHVHQH